HPVRLLLDGMPELLVELGTLSRPGGAPAGAPLHHGFARRVDRASARQSGRSVPALSLPHHHELRQGLPQAPPSRENDRPNEAPADRTAGAGICTRIAANGPAPKWPAR